MYTRKIKLLGGGGKKKSKSSSSSTAPVSNWGPRIALIEREKALSSIQSTDTSTYHQHQQNIRSEPNPYNSNSGRNTLTSTTTTFKALADQKAQRNKKISISSSSHDGSSSANNYIYNNYGRKASLSSGTNKSAITSSASSHRSSSNAGLNGSAYILGSNCGSHITLGGSSSVGDTLSQPLTLIIPPQDSSRLLSGFESDFDDSAAPTRYYGGRQPTASTNKPDRGQDSFPSMRTYHSSSNSSEDDTSPSDAEEPSDNNSDLGEREIPKRLPNKEWEHSQKNYSHRNPNKKPMQVRNQTFSDPSVGSGILKISSTKPQVHHNSQKDSLDHNFPSESSSSSSASPSSSNNITVIDDYDLSGSSNDPNNLNGTGSSSSKLLKSPELSSALKNISGSIYNGSSTYNGNKTNTIGSTISSLAHGITMVYVPMESLPRSKSAAALNASLEFDPTQPDPTKEEDIPQIEEPIASPILQPTPPSNNTNNPDKDPDNDSLLESFDSIMFKPKDEPKLSPWSNASCPTTSPESSPVLNSSVLPSKGEDRPKLSRGNLPQPPPPPLPPKNLIRSTTSKSKAPAVPNILTSDQLKPKPPQRNLKSSLRHTESSIRSAVEKLENIINPNPNSSNKTNTDSPPKSKPITTKSKRVTLTLPRENPPTHQELMINLSNEYDPAEGDAYSSTFLTCGHVLRDDDYSTLSSSHSISPIHKRMEFNEKFKNGDDCNSAGERDVSPVGSNFSNEDPVENRSVIQQLRELSILIGGGDFTQKLQQDDKIFTRMQITGQARNELESKNNNYSSSRSANANANAKSFRLHDEISSQRPPPHNSHSKRKTSDATDHSGDSGKGSGGSGASPKSSTTNSSQTSHLLHIVNAGNPNCQSIPKQSKFCPNRPDKPCVFRSDCNECLLYSKPPNGFIKPNNSEELCSNAVCLNNKDSSPLTSKKKSSRNSNSLKKPSKLVRRKSSKITKPASFKSKSIGKKGNKKPLILDYCDCSNCDENGSIFIGNCCDRLEDINFNDDDSRNISRAPQSNPTQNESESFSKITRKVSSSSSCSTGSGSVKLSRSTAFRGPKIKSPQIAIPPGESNSKGLFTIEETEESQSVEVMLKGRRNSVSSSVGTSSPGSSFEDHLGRLERLHRGENGDIGVTRGSRHWHPNCWLAASDPQLGWSDLESLYSVNAKADQPLSINGECWTCWQEISQIKKNSENPNGTVDRTKRMFIWLNKRHKEFTAPWWEAKKQASIRWIMTKALSHVPKEYLIDPFKESKKGKPTTYRLRDEVTRGLVSGKLYSLSLVNLYQETLGAKGSTPTSLHHWDIIKILSRRGVYVAQPSDMKLTEGTLRQKPIRIAAHIAMIEAIMSLYSKEILARERIIATLHHFGCTVKQETTSPEKLVIAWINAAVMTLKTYIMSTRNHQLSPEKQNRWLQLPKVGEIRDLCDGVGLCSLFAIYCSNNLKVCEISVPDPGETLTIYDSITNHSLVQKLCEELFPETIYHLCVTDFLYIHGYMKQNILCFLVDLFIHLEVNPVLSVNRLTHVPIRVEL